MPGDPPLSDLKVVELGSIGPGPFCAMMLADHGAQVLRIVRPGSGPPRPTDPLHRSRPALPLDLKDERQRALLRRLIGGADVLIEGFRPGVIERLGLAPDDLLAANPRLVIGRMTGWGQDGLRSASAGHDINYLATGGVLHALGLAGGRPTPPINLLADFGGGGMMLAFGILAAINAARRTGRGDVVDAAMAEGGALLSTMIWGYRARAEWSDERGTNLLDTGAPFYDCYETADGGWIAIAPIEPVFWRQFADAIGLPIAEGAPHPPARTDWPELRSEIERRVAQRSRAEWEQVFATHDACATPVLSFDEALADGHNVARRSFVEVDGVHQPAPAPRYAVAGTVTPRLPTGDDVRQILRSLGLSEEEAAGLASQPPPASNGEALP